MQLLEVMFMVDSELFKERVKAVVSQEYTFEFLGENFDQIVSFLTDTKAEKIYQDLQEQGVKVLYDDREKSIGEKFADADLIGIPNRLVVSKNTLSTDSLELKKRINNKISLVRIDQLKKII